jgi:hypothetical protein
MLDDGLAAEIEQDLTRQARGSDAGGDAESDGGHEMERVEDCVED